MKYFILFFLISFSAHSYGDPELRRYSDEILFKIESGLANTVDVVNTLIVTDQGETRVSDLIHAIIKKGADVNASNDQGVTFLMRIAGAGTRYLSVMESLIRYGADVNAQDNNGLTALMYAVESPDRYGQQGMFNVFPAKLDTRDIDLLIAMGADLNITDNRGMTVIDRIKASAAEAILALDGNVVKNLEIYSSDKAKKRLVKHMAKLQRNDISSEKRYQDLQWERRIISNLGDQEREMNKSVRELMDRFTYSEERSYQEARDVIRGYSQETRGSFSDLELANAFMDRVLSDIESGEEDRYRRALVLMANENIRFFLMINKAEVLCNYPAKYHSYIDMLESMLSYTNVEAVTRHNLQDTRMLAQRTKKLNSLRRSIRVYRVGR